MPAGTLTSVKEYLDSSYHPDREFIDGSVLERCLGERDHSELQAESLSIWPVCAEGSGYMSIPSKESRFQQHDFAFPTSA